MKKRILFVMLFLLLFVGFAKQGLCGTFDIDSGIRYETEFTQLRSFGERIYGMRDTTFIENPQIRIRTDNDYVGGYPITGTITFSTEDGHVFAENNIAITFNNNNEEVYVEIPDLNDATYTEKDNIEFYINVSLTYGNGTSVNMYETQSFYYRERPRMGLNMGNLVIFGEPDKNKEETFTVTMQCPSDCLRIAAIGYNFTINGRLYKYRDACENGAVQKNQRYQNDYIQINEVFQYEGQSQKDITIELSEISKNYTYQGFYAGELSITDHYGNEVDTADVFYANEFGYLTGKDVCNYYESYPIDKSDAKEFEEREERDWNPVDFSRKFEDRTCESGYVIQDAQWKQLSMLNIDRKTMDYENEQKIVWGFRPRYPYIDTKYNVLLNWSCGRKPEAKLSIYNFRDEDALFGLKFYEDFYGPQTITKENYMGQTKINYENEKHELRKTLTNSVYTDEDSFTINKQVYDLGFYMLGPNEIASGEYTYTLDTEQGTYQGDNIVAGFDIPIKLSIGTSIDISPQIWTGTSSGSSGGSTTQQQQTDDTTDNETKMLEIKNVKFKIGTRSYSIDEEDPFEIAKGQYGDTITIEAKLYNNFDDETKIEDVELEVESDFDDDIYTSSKQDIDGDEREEFSIEFDVPIDVEETSYEVVLTAEGYDENGDKQTDEFKFDVEINLPTRALTIKEAELSPSVLSCTNETELTFEIINSGEEDIDDVYVEIYSDSLGIRERINVPYEMESDVDSDDREFRETVTITPDMIVAEHDIQIRAYSGSTEKAGKTIALDILECRPEAPSQTQVIEPLPEYNESSMTTPGLKQEDNTFVLLGLGAGVVVVMGGILFVLLKFVI